MKWAYVEEIYEAAAQVEGFSFNQEVARAGKTRKRHVYLLSATSLERPTGINSARLTYSFN